MIELSSLEDLSHFLAQEVGCEVIVTPPDPESETIDGQGFWRIEIYDEN
ncbi:hypothetical protein AVDCRST_MAG94-6548 [uncultured Leptolyngbya sp.]|uniref:Uncharacterized protein n=1 Tax=uncultured Leptolyngbya sp. TaxID=332963 RepID=A0A6J4PK14_9CYAN|nr:hypothetical protein AVDCRST_MAG94-6548 [uncultured Leptolyngbya sp.]